MQQNSSETTVQAARRWGFLLSVLLFVIGLIMTVFGFTGPIQTASEVAHTPEVQSRRHLQVAGPAFLAASITMWLVGGIYVRLWKSDWLQKQAAMELDQRGGAVRAFAVDVIRHRVSPALIHDPDLQRMLLSRLRRRSSTRRRSMELEGPSRRCSHCGSTSADRRRSSVSQSTNVHGVYRKRSSTQSQYSAAASGNVTKTQNVDQLPGIRIQHIEALPYHVAEACSHRAQRQGCDDSAAAGAAVDLAAVTAATARSGESGSGGEANTQRYIIIHNELSSASSLSRSRSRSSKASSINFSSLESDIDPTTVTMAAPSTTSYSDGRRRLSMQQETETSTGAQTKPKHRRLSHEVRRERRDDDNDDDDEATLTSQKDMTPGSRRTSSLSHVDSRNSVILVEVVCECPAGSQQGRRALSDSPLQRSPAHAAVIGASLSDTSIRPSTMQNDCVESATGGGLLQTATTSRQDSINSMRRKSSVQSTVSASRIDEVEELDNVDNLLPQQQAKSTQDDAACAESDCNTELDAADGTRVNRDFNSQGQPLSSMRQPTATVSACCPQRKKASSLLTATRQTGNAQT